ncbi:DMT family transporter [Hyphobacterium marinum]|uniref:EamA family transporter n=1 Tax=Hyphobacterium marinum TaxID=3116574 RepID=A0ABU7LZU6_9PROT|nr:EamA family transporter [Hyphobacterium sp. Y6023]MEE2567073.1 EamA family transporter [Hyphobacterium sp. Y6023]
MLISVAAYASYPVVAVFAQGEINPLMFVGIAHVTALIASAAVLFIWGKRDSRPYLAATLDGFKNRYAFASIAFGGITNAISHASLFAAVYFAPAAVVTLLYETWPIAAMYLFYVWMRHHYRPFLASDYVFSGVAFIGLAIVVYSGPQTSEVAVPSGEMLALGIGLALLSSLTMATSSGAGIWTTRFYEKHHPSLPASFMVQLGTKIFSGLGPIIVALFLPRGTEFSGLGLGLAVGSGLFIVTIGASFYLVANTMARSTSINILYYLTPVLSLALLAAFGLDQIGPAIALGAILIIASNLLIYGRADPSYAYTASLLMLMLSATYVFYVPGLEMDSFYDALAVPAAIFAILIAFMLDRVFQRANSQEQLVIDLLQKFEADSKGAQKQGYWVIRIWAANSDAEVKQTLDEAKSALPKSLVLDLYALGLKKMSIFSFGERFIVIVVATMVVAIANIFRPNSMVAELMAPALSSAVVFLTSTIFDRLEVRTNRQLQNGLLSLVDPSAQKSDDGMTERPFFSSVLIFLIFVSYVYVVLSS